MNLQIPVVGFDDAAEHDEGDVKAVHGLNQQRGITGGCADDPEVDEFDNDRRTKGSAFVLAGIVGVDDVVLAVEGEITAGVSGELDVVGEGNDVAAGEGFKKRGAALDGGEHLGVWAGGGALDFKILVP